MLTHGTYLIDTDVCIELTRKNPIVVEHVRAVGAFEYMFIAATALEEDLILVTGNTDHFERIPGLRIENWMEG